MRLSKKLLFFIIILPVIVFLGVMIWVWFPAPNIQTQPPTITPTPFTPNEAGGAPKLTPLQQFEIGKTTDNEIIFSHEVIDTSTRGDINIYRVRSKLSGQIDEIRTENGRVILERINTQTLRVNPIPKVNDYVKEFGEPEQILEKVGPEGWFTTAFLYPSKGFILYGNRYTNTVYEIQRFSPMTISEYRERFPEFVAPAPTPQGERFQ